jgi:hypothetical protein
MLCSIKDLIREYSAGQISGYFDVIRLSHQ